MKNEQPAVKDYAEFALLAPCLALAVFFRVMWLTICQRKGESE